MISLQQFWGFFYTFLCSRISFVHVLVMAGVQHVCRSAARGQRLAREILEILTERYPVCKHGRIAA